jgi:hypothetical protein
MSRINLSTFARSPAVLISLIIAPNYLSRRDALKENADSESDDERTNYKVTSGSPLLRDRGDGEGEESIVIISRLWMNSVSCAVVAGSDAPRAFVKHGALSESIRRDSKDIPRH